MKTNLLIPVAMCLATGPLLAQSISGTENFFGDSIKVRRPGSPTLLLNLEARNDLYSPTNPQVTANKQWSFSAGGHIQVGANVLELVNVDAQLASYTSSANGDLVFGREIVTTIASNPLGLDLGPSVQGLLNQIIGASVGYQWQADGVISGLSIAANQQYRVSFDMACAAGLPVQLLQSSNFGITTAGVTSTTGGSATLLNLLDVVTLGDEADTGTFEFVFTSNQALNELNFRFAAQSLGNIHALGGTASNQEVLRFSNFEVVPVPEPSSLALSGLAVGAAMFRRRRNG